MRLYWCPETAQPGDRRQRVDRLMRAALAPLLGLTPDALLFGRESKGRPFLRHAGAPDFNLSDTHGGTLIAICGHGRIGVDLERLDRQPPVLRLAARWFTPAERQVLATLSAEAARVAFLRLWTAKEASCKATGTGIFGFLDQWRFDPQEEAPRLLDAPADAGPASRWRFIRLSPSPAHTAVLALRDAPDLSVRAFELSG